MSCFAPGQSLFCYMGFGALQHSSKNAKLGEGLAATVNDSRSRPCASSIFSAADAGPRGSEFPRSGSSSHRKSSRLLPPLSHSERAIRYRVRPAAHFLPVDERTWKFCLIGNYQPQRAIRFDDVDPVDIDLMKTPSCETREIRRTLLLKPLPLHRSAQFTPAHR